MKPASTCARQQMSTALHTGGEVCWLRSGGDDYLDHVSGEPSIHSEFDNRRWLQQSHER